jgi:hypothetical protein
MQEVRIMELRTHRNGGDAPIHAVADAWKAEAHEFHWSEYAHDQWAVELAHKLHDQDVKARADHTGYAKH